MRHLLSIADLNKEELFSILDNATKIKQELKEGKKHTDFLKGMTLGMIFEKPSLRTRVSFETGMTQFGGHAVYLAPSDIGLGKRESVSDIARTISRMCDIVMARVFSHSVLKEFAENSEVPVINALSDIEHPCQILADFMTILEKKGKLEGLNLAFIGDGNNNVTHSLAIGSAIMGINFRVSSPDKYRMQNFVKEKAGANRDSLFLETEDPKKAADDADIVYTDTWVSMGSESEKADRIKDFQNFRVTKELMDLAKPDALFMHDLPAYRGNEVVREVIDGPRSIVFDQAENRLHAQKALMLFLLGKM